VRWAGLARPDWRAAVVYIGFALVFAFFAVTQTEHFLTATNVTNIVVQAAPITVMAMGAVFVLAIGEIDLSIGSTVAVAALASALTIEGTGLWWLGALVGVGTGLATGAVNGLFITGLLTGLARQLTDLQSVPVTEPTFTSAFGNGKVLGVPVFVIWTLVATLMAWHVLRQRTFGAHALAVGDRTESARVSGLKVNRIRMAVFMVSGATAAFAGVLYTGRLRGAKYTLGESDLMTVLAAVIVGGTALSGGKASVVGALVGSLLMSMINNGLILAGLDVTGQMIVRGLIILVAVSLSLRGKKND
jgi:ribose transport system permease protein